MRARTRQLSGRSCGRLSRKSIRRRNRFPLTIRRPKHLCLPESWSARTAGILWLPPAKHSAGKMALSSTIRSYVPFEFFENDGHWAFCGGSCLGCCLLGLFGLGRLLVGGGLRHFTGAGLAILQFCTAMLAIRHSSFPFLF